MFSNIKDGFRKGWRVKPVKKKATPSLENERPCLILKVQNKAPKQLGGEGEREEGGWRVHKHEIGSTCIFEPATPFQYNIQSTGPSHHSQHPLNPSVFMSFCDPLGWLLFPGRAGCVPCQPRLLAHGSCL